MKTCKSKRVIMNLALALVVVCGAMAQTAKLGGYQKKELINKFYESARLETIQMMSNLASVGQLAVREGIRGFGSTDSRDLAFILVERQLDKYTSREVKEKYLASITKSLEGRALEMDLQEVDRVEKELAIFKAWVKAGFLHQVDFALRFDGITAQVALISAYVEYQSRVDQLEAVLMQWIEGLCSSLMSSL